MKKSLFSSLSIAFCFASYSATLMKIEKENGSIVDFDVEEVVQVELIEEEVNYEYVDLGLSVKWATFNVGATKPEEFGSYYAWGEVSPKETYTPENYIWCDGKIDKLTKYNTSGGSGMIIDNLTTLNPEDDAAYVNWGKEWRIPTSDEWEELLNKCSWEWTYLNGVKGCKVTAENGNWIFLPAAGRAYNGREYYNVRGEYRTKTTKKYESSFDYGVFFSAEKQEMKYSYRYFGHTVRPVCAIK